MNGCYNGVPKDSIHEEMDSFAFEGYQERFLHYRAKTPRFGSGEGKCTINESVRGDDIYVMVDVTNYSLSYRSDLTRILCPLMITSRI